VALDRLDALRMLDHAGQLAAHERSVLMLRAQGAGAADVAGELGVSYKSVEGAYTRARRKLRAAAGAAIALAALGLRYLLRGVSATPAMAAVVAALAVLAVPVPSAARTNPVRTPADSAVRSAHRVAPPRTSLQEPSRTAAPPTPPAATSTPAATTARGSAAPSQISAIDVRAAGAGAPVSVHRRDASESFTQTLVRCVATGPSLDPGRLGCRP
jgi:DNA-binding CsgD family transcriptional regulator